jgi:hypothetical protein
MTDVTTDLAEAIRSFYDEIDANDPSAFDNHLAPGAVFAFNDLDPVVGVGPIRDFVAAWKNNFQSVIHELTALSIDRDRGTAGVEILVSYVFPDGRVVKVKGASFLDFAAEAISAWRVYVDTSRLG